MKCRRTLLMLALLLLVASLAGAASMAPTAPSPAVSTATASPFCAASLLQLKPAADGVPAPAPMAFTQTCGVCSDSYCQGAVANSTCFFLTRFGYQQGRCALWLGDRCPEDNKWDCLCTNQPLP